MNDDLPFISEPCEKAYQKLVEEGVICTRDQFRSVIQTFVFQDELSKVNYEKFKDKRVKEIEIERFFIEKQYEETKEFKEGRKRAINLQHTLFPAKLYCEYEDYKTKLNNWRRIPPTLLEICLDVRMSLNGSADEWISYIDVLEMLVERDKYWYISEDAIDKSIRMILQLTICLIQDKLKDI